jgi:hypothetical protein
MHVFILLINSKNISSNPKLNIYRTIIRPIVMYASETWQPRKLEEKMIITWERKIVRNFWTQEGRWDLENKN